MSSNAHGALAERFASAGLDWIVPRWPVPAHVHAFVTTRNGGVGASASLDLRSHAADPGVADSIAENWRRVRAYLPADPAWLEQVHGADVVAASREPLPHAQERVSREGNRRAPAIAAPRADAAVTRDTDVVLSVRVADCLPVLLADRAGAVVGIAHAGWRGLAAGVLENAVAAMNCDSATIVAWFGPAIGPTAFEVGADVRDAFVEADPAAGAAFVAGRPGKWLGHLEALARIRLVRCGVTSIHGGGMCTVSEAGRFFSFRRDRTPARMAAFLWRAGSRS